MRERASRRFALAGLRYQLGAVTTVAVVMAGGIAAARAADSLTMVASRYSGSDLTGGQSAWPPRAAPKPDVTPLWPESKNDGKTQPPMPPFADQPAEQQIRVQAAQSSGQNSQSAGGIISEIRLGALIHDAGLVTRRRESGTDISAEVLFVSPGLLDPIGAPRPLIGLAVNTVGDTSQLYGGLTWTWDFAEPLFVEGSLGLTVHDGDLTASAGGKSLGCRVLFRESVALGARFLLRHSISLVFAHISNASLCSKNDGLDTIGVSYGYMF